MKSIYSSPRSTIRKEVRKVFSNKRADSTVSKPDSQFWKKIEKISLILGILGVLVSTAFAIQTYRNTDQINKLDRLIELNSSSVEKLISVTNELKQENSSLKNIDISLITQLDQLKTENQSLYTINLRLAKQIGEAKNQSKLLASQYQINNNEHTIKVRDIEVKHKVDSLSLLSDMNNLWDPPNINILFSYDSVQQQKYILRILPLLNSIFSNDIVIRNNILLKEWLYIRLITLSWKSLYYNERTEDFFVGESKFDGKKYTKSVLHGIEVYRESRKSAFDDIIVRMNRLCIRTFDELQP